MGEPKLLTAELQDRIAEHLKEGHGGTEAARLAGISKSSYYEWLKQAREDEAAGLETVYTRFAEVVAEAEAELEHTNLARIRAAAESGPKGWTASAWLLERRFPGRWSLRNRVELAGADGEPVELKIVFDKAPGKGKAADDQDSNAPS